MQPKSQTTNSLRSMTRSPGTACGFEPFGPERDDRIEAVPARATLSHRELQRHREVALGGMLAQPGQQTLERVVGDRARAADAIDLAGVLHSAQPFDELARGYEVDARERLGVFELLRPRDRVLLEPEPRPGVDRASKDLALDRTGGADLDVGTCTRRVELLVRTLRVAPVGDEAGAVPGDEQHAGRTGEPGQVTDIGELRDEQRIDARARDQLLQPTEARAHFERDEGCGRERGGHA